MTTSRKDELILFLAGFLLILLQFFMIREVTALLRGTEMVIFLVAIAYFAGYSIGYGVSGFLSMARIKHLAILFWAVHLTLPFSLRYIAGSLAGPGGAPAAVFAGALFFTALALSSFYSLLLPSLIDLAGEGADSLVRLYAAELAGAVAGVAAALTLGGVIWAQPIMYQAALAALMALLLGGRRAVAAAAIALIAYAAAFPALDGRSLAYYYENVRGIRGAKILRSVNSPYQKVDFVESGFGGRYIFLNGNMNFGSRSLTLFNTYLSRLPAVLVNPEKALVIGAGSMQSLRNVAPIARSVDIVEIDGAVPDGSLEFLRSVNEADSFTNWTLHIEDAKHFLNTTQNRYGLIVVDVPAPLTIQVGLLHSVEFYEMAAKRLTDRGVISISLSGRFMEKNPTPLTVAAAALRVFPGLFVYTPDNAGRSFLLAGRALPFGRDQIEKTSSMLGAKETLVYDKNEAAAIVGDTQPMTAGAMSYPVKRSWRRIQSRFLMDEQ